MDYSNEIQKCVQALKKGKVILYPTDTIWGLGCDATNDNAIKKIYAIKKRSESKAMISLLANYSSLNQHVKDIPNETMIATKRSLILSSAGTSVKNLISEFQIVPPTKNSINNCISWM